MSKSGIAKQESGRRAPTEPKSRSWKVIPAIGARSTILKARATPTMHTEL